MLFARSACEEKELVTKILEVAMERGIFDQSLYEAYGIITSAAIQQEYLRICRQSKRKQVIMIKEYCLTTDPDLQTAITEMKSLAEQPAADPDPSPEKSSVDKAEKTQKQKSKVNSASSPSMQAALHLRNKVMKNNPRSIVPGDDPQDPLLAKWCSELDILHLKGPPGAKVADNRGYSWKEINALIEYCQNDDFWVAHILCPADLRKKAITLETKMRRLTDTDTKSSGERSSDDMAGKYRKYVG